MNARTPIKAASLRCAVYSRKSSEEGLDQAFNSLHAQREACEAYALSQAGEGWIALPTAYDDGGFSGGSMERPALKRLLTDIAAGRIDVVVVYKIDRLTRSLSDFARIVDTFDAAGASFVSVTQAFNTTTSMGRLTLNVLLSFAQFEREVTGERIRDKIAQSKARGMWMGGIVPLGYDPGDHTLIVNEAEAEQVRRIFKRYLKIGSVHRLCDELGARRQTSKAWVTKAGRPMGGAPFSRGALFHLLQNRHYLGEIRHKDLCHPGNHPGILDPKLFDAVQQRIAANRVKRESHAGDTTKAPLMGLIFDGEGRLMIPTFSYGRSGRCYRYYVASDLQLGRRLGKSRGGGGADGGANGGSDGAPRRLPAKAVEAAMLTHLRRLSQRPHAAWQDLAPILQRIEVRATDTQLLLNAEALFDGDHPGLAFEDLEQRLHAGERLVWETGRAGVLRLALPGKLQFRGGRTWRTAGGHLSTVDPQVIPALKWAHQILADAGCSLSASPASWAQATSPTSAYHRKVAGLAFLSPALQAAILGGKLPGVTLQGLLAKNIPLAWVDQAAAFGSNPGLPGCDSLRTLAS